MAADTTPKNDTPETTASTDKTPLSERELEILRLVATGASNKQIAQRLVISTNTVKVHLRNIFAKINVASRTEAALYAVQTGIVSMAPINAPDSPAAMQTPIDLPVHEQAQLNAALQSLESLSVVPVKSRWPWLYWLILGSISLTVILLGWALVRYLQFYPFVPPSNASTAAPRWQSQPEMPTARSSVAVATYDGQIYAIAGENLNGPLAIVEKFDPATREWFSLPPKPLAVADVQAAVVGGNIYVPGGHAAGGLTDRLEVYNPRGNQWEQRAPLPLKLSAYAMVAFEGKLYVFGGWDGQQYLDTVYEYNPDVDAWTQKTSMPTARGFAGAAVVEGKIYLIGGKTRNRISDLNEIYSPEHDSPGASPWTSAPLLPSASYGSGIASIAERLYIIGGQTETGEIAPTLIYAPHTKQWENALDFPALNGYFARAIALGNDLYVLGGKSDQQFSAQTFSYRALYTVALPIVR